MEAEALTNTSSKILSGDHTKQALFSYLLHHAIENVDIFKHYVPTLYNSPLPLTSNSTDLQAYTDFLSKAERQEQQKAKKDAKRAVVDAKKA